MRIPLFVSLPIVAALACLGWRNQRQIGELRTTQKQLTSRTASSGVLLGSTSPGETNTRAKRQRPDHVAEAKLAAAGLVAYAAELPLMKDVSSDVKDRRILAETERVQSLNGSQLKILIAELQSADGMDATTRTLFIRFAIGQLVQTNPRNALEILLESPELDPPNYSSQPSRHLFTEAIRAWAMLAPHAAQTWFQENRSRLGDPHASAIEETLVDVAASFDPQLALQLFSDLGLEKRGLSTLIERSSKNPEARLALHTAWRTWAATRPDREVQEFPVPQYPQTANIPTAPDGHLVAKPVPGKEGFVFSPFNNTIIDARGMPSGTLVSDPSAPPTEKWIFRVP